LLQETLNVNENGIKFENLRLSVTIALFLPLTSLQEVQGVLPKASKSFQKLTKPSKSFQKLQKNFKKL